MSGGLFLSWRNRAIRLRAWYLPESFWPSLVLPDAGWFLHLRVRRIVGDASTAWLLRTSGIDGRDSMRTRIVFIRFWRRHLHDRSGGNLRRFSRCDQRDTRAGGVFLERRCHVCHRLRHQHICSGGRLCQLHSHAQRQLCGSRSVRVPTLRAGHVRRRPWSWVLPGRSGILCRDRGRGVAAGVRGRHVLAGWRVVVQRLSGRLFLGGCRVVVQRLSGRQRLGSW
jgi:hypothetical protein